MFLTVLTKYGQFIESLRNEIFDVLFMKAILDLCVILRTFVILSRLFGVASSFLSLWEASQNSLPQIRCLGLLAVQNLCTTFRFYFRKNYISADFSQGRRSFTTFSQPCQNPLLGLCGLKLACPSLQKLRFLRSGRLLSLRLPFAFAHSCLPQIRLLDYAGLHVLFFITKKLCFFCIQINIAADEFRATHSLYRKSASWISSTLGFVVALLTQPQL